MTWRCGYVLKRVGQNLLQTKVSARESAKLCKLLVAWFLCSSELSVARAVRNAKQGSLEHNFRRSSHRAILCKTFGSLIFTLERHFLHSSGQVEFWNFQNCVWSSNLIFKVPKLMFLVQKHGKTLYNLKTFPIWIRLLKIMSNSQTQNLKLHTMIHVCIKLSLCPFKTCLSGIRTTNTWGIHQVGVWKCHACKNLMNSNSKYACMYPIQLYSSISWYS